MKAVTPKSGGFFLPIMMETLGVVDLNKARSNFSISQSDSWDVNGWLRIGAMADYSPEQSVYLAKWKPRRRSGAKALVQFQFLFGSEAVQ